MNAPIKALSAMLVASARKPKVWTKREEDKDLGTTTFGAIVMATTGDQKVPTPSRCKLCEEGFTPDEHGDHWIPTSLIPARIKIIKCKNAAASVVKDHQS